MEFLYNARNLEAYTIKKVTNFPKRVTFFVSIPLANIAGSIHILVKKANTIYPTNQHEAQLRRDFFLEALGELQAFVSKLELAEPICHIKGNEMAHWMELVMKEQRLIKALLRVERDKFKNLPIGYILNNANSDSNARYINNNGNYNNNNVNNTYGVPL